MMVMTTKVDFKKILIGLIAAVAVIVGLVVLFGGSADDAASTAALTPTTGVTGNDARLEFLKGFGWEPSSSPSESSQVKIPAESSDVFDRYNALQKSQGYDLSQYAGKTVMRYVYQINNFPGATEPVYATLLVHKNQVIGGDITDTSPKGVIQGFQRSGQNTADPTQVTVPIETGDTAPTG